MAVSPDTFNTTTTAPSYPLGHQHHLVDQAPSSEKVESTAASGTKSKWKNIFKRAVSGGATNPTGNVQHAQTVPTSTGLLSPSTPKSGPFHNEGDGHQRHHTHPDSSIDTHHGNGSLTTSSPGGATAQSTSGEGSASSVHLPLTPIHISPTQHSPVYPINSYSISTDRSSASSGTAPPGLYSSATSKNKFFPFGPTQNQQTAAPAPPSPRVRSEKKDKFRTLGRLGPTHTKTPPANQVASYSAYTCSPGDSIESPTQLAHAATNVETPQSQHSAARRFIRRVASAPNAKGLFSSGSLFNRAAEHEMPTNSHLGGSQSGKASRSNQASDPSSLHVVINETSSDDSPTEPHMTSHSSKPSPSDLRVLSESPEAGPMTTSNVSLGSVSTDSLGGFSALRIGPREHRAQSVGVLSKSGSSVGLGKQPGGGQQPGFRRTYSSNSIKSKTVSRRETIMK